MVNEEARARNIASHFNRGDDIPALCKRFKVTPAELIAALKAGLEIGTVNQGQYQARVIQGSLQFPFPDESEKRLDNLLKCLNSELKLATFFALRRGITASVNELAERIEHLVPDFELPHETTFGGYCADLFLKSGFVVQERYQRYQSVDVRQYGLTEAGFRYAQPLAAHSLVFAVEHNFSLFSLFGLGKSNREGDVACPLNRVHVLEAVGKGADTFSAVADLSGFNRESVKGQLQALQDLGILTFETTKQDSPRYAWNRDHEVEGLVVGEGTLAALLHQRGSLTSEELAARSEMDIRKVRDTLSELRKKGYVTSSDYTPGGQSIVVVENSKLLQDVLEYVGFVRGALQDGPQLQEAQQTLASLRNDKNAMALYLEHGIAAYLQISPFRHRLSSAEREMIALDYITSRGEIQPKDVAEGLEWTASTTYRIINQLESTGKVTRRVEGNIPFYSVKGGEPENS